MRLDQWEAIGIVSGSLLTLLTLIGLLYRWVARPMWRTLRRLNEVADQLLGDKTKRIPSMTERMTALETGQRELRDQLQKHLDGHALGGLDDAPRGPVPRGRPEPRRR
jgi:hypothetical protein